MIGETILHYKILEKLGEGGMGVVYKAHDTKLARTVALKFLPHYLTSDSNEKERFYHEARAAASIMHPNVGVIYEIGEHDGQLFIAMEYVEGKTLKKIIENESEALSTKKVLDISIQVCEGLAAAHEKGIVHRDIKSENIMLTPKDQVKIMDFGLAKITGATKLTQDGSTLGTAAYMSPEQAQGLEIDNRSDIFSFGVVLYEMLTIHLPFKGDYQPALLYSLMNEDPQPVARYNDRVSLEFERIAFKALAKDREERYQHVEDMLADLRKERKDLEYAESGYVKAATVQQTAATITGAKEKTEEPKSESGKKKKIIIASTAAILLATLIVSYLLFFNKNSAELSATGFKKSIAVLPFENLSSDKNNAYFASGMEDMILTKLAGIRKLKVISRTSTDRYKSKPENLKTIAKQLNVATVLEGSVQRSNNEVLINVQLIDVKTDSHIWAKAYTRTLENVFNVEGEVAGRIAQALQIKLVPNEKYSLNSTPTDNPKAYDLYLQASYKIHEYHKKGILPIDALGLFHKAIKIDSNFALAYASLSDAEFLWYQLKNDDSLLVASIADAKHSIKIDPGLAAGHLQLGYLFRSQNQFKNAQSEFDKALKLSPGNADILDNIAFVDGIREGLWNDAIKYIRKAAELDPQNSSIIADYAYIEFALRNYGDASQLYERAHQTDPDNYSILVVEAFTLTRIGKQNRAKKLLEYCRKNTKSKVFLMKIFEFQWWLNYYSHNYKLAKTYADSITTIAKILSRNNNTKGYTKRIIQSQAWAGTASYFLKDNKSVKNYFGRVIPTLKNFRPHLTFINIQRLVFLAMSQAFAGQKQAAIANIKKVFELEPEAYCYSCHYYHVELSAVIYALHGDAVHAVPLLKEVLSAQGTGLTLTGFLLRSEPAFDRIRSNPAFQELESKYPKDY